MRILFVGGSGYIGGLILPELGRRHSVRVLDLRPPQSECEYIVADATDPDAVAEAMSGMDAVLHGAMGRVVEWPGSASDAANQLDVNVKSAYLTLRQAHEAGVPHGVYLSSMSVYRDLPGRESLTEEVPADATDSYGLTKRLGEQVCRAAVAEWGMSVNVLRLALPTRDDAWPAWSYPPGESKLMQTDRGGTATGARRQRPRARRARGAGAPQRVRGVQHRR